ncbi:hypothetical protein TCAL_10356 [Tigriopus californicus]|uniref:Glutathione transferase n=1 Tax=Tigriopus californicus TaxID=6832 RepID=A0A553PG87_TIGCA|nr:hematopoietic prostaglandin D synthase-like [Tigriopus californicus]TRY76684.1 hypothetical protein TCAL_10356 [Tigriopus californicus]|eukprot:TCALIF_10356-PA protein Name:"Similar to HPGDS Hematopoietic prostaglandin D synthase (Gallus gallus)" AED:0.07 eAED:0.03 QI:160/0.75/0.4/1/0.75/0.8/5/80/233
MGNGINALRLSSKKPPTEDFYLSREHPKVKLIYFDVKGRAELIRLILVVGEVDFQDYRARGDWSEIKQTTPFGQLPILEYGDIKVAQSIAIARYVAKKTGLAGDTDEEQAFADMIVDHISDQFTIVMRIFSASTPEMRLDVAKEIYKKKIPTFLKYAEDFLMDMGGTHFTGNKLSYGDIAMFNFLNMLLEDSGPFAVLQNKVDRATILNSYPHLSDLFHSVKDHPKIREYYGK